MVVTQKSISFDFKDAILSSMWLCIPLSSFSFGKDLVRTGDNWQLSSWARRKRIIHARQVGGLLIDSRFPWLQGALNFMA